MTWIRPALGATLALIGTAAHASAASLSLSSRYAQLIPGQSFHLAASGGRVIWQVDNVDGGTATTGTITAGGVYTAPSRVPPSASATITAVSASDPTVSATATMTLLAHAPTGRTYIVATDGDDANPGTPAAPFRTIHHAALLAAAGDTVLVHAGSYNELLAPPASGSAATGYITFSAYPGEAVAIDGTGLTIPGGQYGLVTLQDASYVVIQGFELRHYASASRNQVPVGVYLTGGGTGVQIVNNRIDAIITTANTGPQACASNALGLAAYGSNAARPIAELVVSGNELDHLVTGCSESMSLDGNVDGFTVASNRVHDNDNIGIDAIGYEGVSPDVNTDRARNGEIRGNTVYSITSYGNPDYGKQYAADGIYVDGGTRIVIEQNIVHDVDFGIELASEHPNKLTSQVIARNNVVYHDNASGITIGGYGPGRGGTDRCTMVNNTLYDNDTKNTGGGEFQVQFNATRNLFENNIVYAGAQALMVHDFTGTGGPTQLDHNLYFSPMGATASIWQYGGTRHVGFPKYRAATGQDANSAFADPLFHSTMVPVLLTPDSGSPAFDLGAAFGAAVIGRTDLGGRKRVDDGAITAGAYE